jgi:hypothetical protein
MNSGFATENVLDEAYSQRAAYLIMKLHERGFGKAQAMDWTNLYLNVKTVAVTVLE